MDSTKSDNRNPKKAPLQVISPLHKASRQVALHLGASLEGFEIAPGEGHILSYVASYEPCPVGEMVRIFGHKRSTLTSILDRLCERGLLVREVNPADRRSFLVSTTPRGADLAEAVRRPVIDLDGEIRDRVAERDYEGFRRVMQAIEEATGIDVRKEEDKPGSED